MVSKGLPQKQGLYDPEYEHDACGIGFIVNVKGEKSHFIVSQAITILKNLSHRGGNGFEENTGDGAGILVQLPHKFLTAEAEKLGFSLQQPGSYGAGMVFLPREIEHREYCEITIEQIIREEGQSLIGWRTVPVDDSAIGFSARASMPCIRQVFIARSEDIKDEMDFERKLYIIRKRAEKALRNERNDCSSNFYIASLSSRTIVYKGMLNACQVDVFYPDINNPDFESCLALVHSRYSTNTFPSWERAHPNRYIIHNGEINTLRGNINRMYARQASLRPKLFGADIAKVFPVIDTEGSDSAMFDNCMEFLTLSGRSLPHAAMMMIPEAWSADKDMSDEKKAFYEYHSCLMEPWDGPAAIAFTDGAVVGAILDRNGLRPARYCITKDGTVIMASETGVLDIPEENIISKERLHPGRMLLIDTKEGRIVNDDELKHRVATAYPYRDWINLHLTDIRNLPGESSAAGAISSACLLQQQIAFGYTYEELTKVIMPMAMDGEEAIGSMGTDTPLAVLSEKPQLLFNYFKQLFAQVTNPPLDSIREEIITSTYVLVGSEADLSAPGPESCRQIKLVSPVLSSKEFAKLKNIKKSGFESITIPVLFNIADEGPGLESALNGVFTSADRAINSGANILILSDRDVNESKAPIPSLLAVAGLHHHLIRQGTRTKVSIILESGEPREVHHFAMLLGYGASAVYPYLAYDTIHSLIFRGLIENLNYTEAVEHYIKAAVKGILKVISKMGISTFQGYQGAQIFEALGISRSVIDMYFCRTPSRIDGIDMDTIAREAYMRHFAAFKQAHPQRVLESDGQYQWRKDGEHHLYNPETIHKLQVACRTNDYKVFTEYSRLLNNDTQRLCTLRGLMSFKPEHNQINIEEVESVDSICRRFKTGAMSYGSISQEAHETLAIAMNRVGGRSNTGEGGEDSARFIPDKNGDSRNSAIKQVASGRFGVTSEYLVNAEELQIKMAQGAKPGEGGQLPGGKVYPWIARVRHSTPGVGLISPPPHHDIYSIEDLAELIYDLKNANRNARISVKLVSEAGVGTIAAGVAKGHADVILISGYDGGTGASPRTSIRHAGLPWELGLSEAHQTLMLNNLRSRVILETDGKLMTGRDVAIAALLGAEEFGFATAPLVALGCVMMRVCSLDTCPVGIATQDPELRKRFTGDPQHVVNFMHFIAQELREIMAGLGFRTVQEMVGHSELLEVRRSPDHWKMKSLDLSCILCKPEATDAPHFVTANPHHLEESLDIRVLLDICKPALSEGKKISATVPVRNMDRAAGTILGSEVTSKFGAQGLPEDTISLHFKGSAGQSFGAFIPKGMTFILEGDSNDYLGKGLSGGKIISYPPKAAAFAAEENIITGNVAFYGATSGEAYICGAAGERFCVRNSGMNAVAEAVGDHGCEYMTGGNVVILGPTGRNFAAGMSGGNAYVLDTGGRFSSKCNMGSVNLEILEDCNEINRVKEMIIKHVRYTGSKHGRNILANWSSNISKFVKVMPKEL